MAQATQHEGGKNNESLPDFDISDGNEGNCKKVCFGRASCQHLVM